MHAKAKHIKIGSRLIGHGEPCYLIAEVGTTCMGDLDKALELIAAAKFAGVDAIKFQLIDPDQLSDDSVTYPISQNGVVTQASMKEMFQKLVFDEASWKVIAAASRDAHLDFFATVDYIDGVDLLDRLGVNVHKIGAWDSTYMQLIKKIGNTGKPMFVDLGPITQRHLDDLVSWYKEAGGGAVLFMHDFHTENDVQMHLRCISKLSEMLPWPVGFSSPAHDHDLDIAALALGSAYIEKRLILNRSDFTFHAHESLEPKELKLWVDRIRHVERALGQAEIIPSDRDIQLSKEHFRSICSVEPIKSGDIFTSANIGAKRPGTGMPTSMLNTLLGKRAARDIPINTLITPKDFS